MAVGKLTVRWEPSPAVMGARLEAMSTAVIKSVRRGLTVNAELTAAELRVLTPRSTPVAGDDDATNDHVADGWKVREVIDRSERDSKGQFVGKADFAIEVYNDNPRFDAPMKIKGGKTSLGMNLEYGSAPHTIKAKPGSRLVFFWPAIGEMVHAKEVEHPGTRPYGMMAIASNDAVQRANRLLAAAQRVIREFNLGVGVKR